jgi:hypothetical protein
MPCEHVGPVELIEMAEEHLRQAGVETSLWPGSHFRWSEDVTGGTWASVILEVERRGEDWIVTRLERSREPLSGDEAGFQVLPSVTSDSA